MPVEDLAILQDAGGEAKQWQEQYSSPPGNQSSQVSLAYGGGAGEL